MTLQRYWPYFLGLKDSLSYLGLFRFSRQGNDWGPQYRAALFPHGDTQHRSADEAIEWARGHLQHVLADVDRYSTSSPEVGTVTVNDRQVKTRSTGHGAGLVSGIGFDAECIAVEQGVVRDSMRTSASRKVAPSKTESSFVGKGEGEMKPVEVEAPVSLPWWESDVIRTMVIPADIDTFVHDPNEAAFS